MLVVADSERPAQCWVRDHFCRGSAGGLFLHLFVQSFPHERITCEFLKSIMTNIYYQLEQCINVKQIKCAGVIADLICSLLQFISAGFTSVLLFKYPQLRQVSETLMQRIFYSVVYFDHLYPVWLQVSLIVNCSCIVVAIIGILLISIDLAHWTPGRELFLQVSPNQSNQTQDSVENLTEIFVMNSWSRWNSAFWCSRLSCRQSSASSSKKNSPNCPDGSRSLHLGSAEGPVGGKEMEMGRGWSWCGGGGVELMELLLFRGKNNAELNHVVCGLHPPLALTESRRLARCFAHDMKQPNFFIFFSACFFNAARLDKWGCLWFLTQACLQLHSLFHMHSTSLYHSVVGFGYCVC